jgi:hypothetical protein
MFTKHLHLVVPKKHLLHKRFVVIGLGEEKDLSLESLRVVGRVAAREAVRLKARHVAWAPVIRDESKTTIEVGEIDRTSLSNSFLLMTQRNAYRHKDLSPQLPIRHVPELSLFLSD